MDNQDRPVKAENPHRPGPDEALSFLMLEAFAEPRALSPGAGYAAYAISPTEYVVLDMRTERTHHFRVTIEDLDHPPVELREPLARP